MGNNKMNYMIGVDVGGTFTDITLINVNDKKIKNHKIRSTPADPSIAIMNGIKEILTKNNIALSELDYLAHGTTVATNALIERKGARTGLLITEGFRDLLEIGNQTRPSLYDLFKQKPEPFVEGYLREEVKERLYSDGSVYKELDRNSLISSIHSLKDKGVEAVAVNLLFSYINPEHEIIVKKELEKYFPEAYISVSHEIVPEFREYSRLSTTVINAYLGPVIKSYMENFKESVLQSGINVEPYITQSNGGIISINESVSYPIRTAVSGPAAGVVAAAHLGKVIDLKNVITFDVGGTSADISLIENGIPKISTERQIEGYPAKIPMLDIVTIGAGGGSIAWIDEGGALKVGPESAGSNPGPACYGNGGTHPTVSDANLVLGRLNPKGILGGEMSLDINAAKTSIQKYICEKANITLEKAAMGIIDVMNANMIRAIRLISVEQGYDPRDFSLVAFGGGGGLHACALAKELKIPKVVIPPASGTFCSLGLLVTDIRSDYVRSFPLKPIDKNKALLQNFFKEMKKQGIALLDKEHIPESKRKFLYSIEARYVGQNYELPIYFNEEELNNLELLLQLFNKEHQKVYGYSYPDSEIQFINYRLTAIGEQPKAPLHFAEIQKRSDIPIKEYRKVYFSNGNDVAYKLTPIYNRDNLVPGDTFNGPAIIEQMDSTTIILPGQQIYVDSYFNLVISVKENTYEEN